jgi:hypothetical protein
MSSISSFFFCLAADEYHEVGVSLQRPCPGAARWSLLAPATILRQKIDMDLHPVQM